MCKAKPGPRCSSHASDRIEKSKQNLDNVLEEVKEWKEKEYEKRTKKDPDAAYPKDTDVPKRMSTKLHNAFSRHRSAQRGYYATPAGIHYLEEAEPQAQRQKIFAEARARGFIEQKYGTRDEESVKDQLKTDPEWNEYRNERTKARAEHTRMANWRRSAMKYRASDTKAGKMERERQSYMAAIQNASTMEEAKAKANEYWEKRTSDDTMSWYKNSSEMQRARDFSSRVPKAEGYGHVGRQEVSNHKIDLPQGGRAQVEVTSGINQQEGGGYYVSHYRTTTIHPDNAEKSYTSRKGFGKNFADAPIEEASRESHVFASEKEAQTWLRENRAQNAYLNASRAVENATRIIEKDNMRRMLAAHAMKDAQQKTPQKVGALA